jgi:hypothetical protein
MIEDEINRHAAHMERKKWRRERYKRRLIRFWW